MINQYKNRPRDSAAEQIECYIIENDLSAHDKLPSERDMCEMWGFNRTTLRSAIHRLAVEGVLYNRIGSGTFVAPEKIVLNLQDLRSFSAVVAQSGRKLTNRVVKARVMECNKHLAQKLQKPLGYKVYELVRVRLVDDVPVLLENSFVDAVRCAGLENRDYTVTSLYDVLEQDYGIFVKSGSEKLGITFADEEEAQLLGIEDGAAVIYRSGVAEDEEHVPIEYFKSIARSEYIRFASVLTR